MNAQVNQMNQMMLNQGALAGAAGAVAAGGAGVLEPLYMCESLAMTAG